jgi:hypothetical protein
VEFWTLGNLEYIILHFFVILLVMYKPVHAELTRVG